MKANREYKNAALAALKDNWAPSVVCAIVITLLVCLLIAPVWISNMSVMGMLGSFTVPATLYKAFTWGSYPVNFLIIYPLTLGYTIAHHRLLRDGDNRLTYNTFQAALDGYLKNLCAIFLLLVYIILWSLLLLIPGIIKSFAYAMTPYILKDNPELSANQAISLSEKMMKGHKFDLFYLCLSFIGWGILCLFTMGIGTVWLMPYMYTAIADFYEDVKKDFQTTNNI